MYSNSFSLKVLENMPWRAIATILQPSRTRGAFRRMISRISRFALFRSTAPPTRRLALTPNLKPASARIAQSTMQRPARLRPFSSTSRNSPLGRANLFLGRRCADAIPLPLPLRARLAQAVSFLRPFLRLRRITSLPVFVLERLRKPCVLLRHLLDGW